VTTVNHKLHSYLLRMNELYNDLYLLLDKWEGKYVEWNVTLEGDDTYIQIVQCPLLFEMQEELSNLEVKFPDLSIFTIVTPVYIPFERLKELI
jgi:hypothetical protein